MDVMTLLGHEEQMTPRLAMIVYDGGGQTRASVNPIKPDAHTGAPVIEPGDPLTFENLEHLSMMLSGGTRRRQLVPANLLMVEQGIVCWWLPSGPRPLFFATGTAFDTVANARIAMHPALMFVGRPGALTVYALQESRRPRADTPLFRAPYYNLYGHGAMCEGTSQIPDAAHPSRIPDYERSFFESSFVHTGLGSEDLTRFPGGHNALWRAMIRRAVSARAARRGVPGKPAKFPSWSLIPLRQGGEPMTVETAINLRPSDRSVY